MATKICVKCKKEKQISEFYIKKSGKPHSYCNECRKLDKKKWDVKNVERVKNYKKQTREHRLKKDAEYREKNRDKLKEVSRIYNGLLREKRRQDRLKPENRKTEKERRKKWIKENRERYNKYFHDFYERFPVKKVMRNLRHRLYKLLRGNIKALHSKDLVGCDLDFLKGHLESQFQEGMTWGNYGLWHVDHVCPGESFDFSKAEQQREFFHWTNLQPLWGADNSSKGAKYNGVDYRLNK